MYTFSHKRTLTAAALVMLLGTSSCGFFETETVIDPNNPSLNAVLANADKAQLDALAVGVEASYRNGHTGNAPFNWVAGVLGREVTVLASTESRWYAELQGTRTTLDDAAYYNGYYVPFAQMRRAAQVFRLSSNNSQAYTAEQKKGVDGFTHTYEALAKLMMLNMQGENGIRIDLDDPLKPGKFVSQADALANIRQLLDQAVPELDAAGATFGFPLSSGYAGFNTPATFKRFNRGLAARVALYQKDYAGAKTALAASFLDAAGSLTVGPKLTFNPAIAGDAGNPYFQVPSNTGSTVIGVPDNVVAEAETGDARLAKIGRRTAARVTGGISQINEARVFATNTSPLDIMRNEELILISAEAKANTNDLPGALADVNIIRTRAGSLPARTRAFVSVDEATDEILRQRRYSLFYEGHAFVDLRRTGRLRPNVVASAATTFPYTLAFSTTIGTNAYRLIAAMPRPAAEKAWDSVNP
ncbi:RagB/SusD family nutrient uptake outer membrane protein [Hymenobacter yonginensis]|uniref:RagB/SusD family nutrient uptake outer membrane protein n=1 Tax=Hymenobacter yonginensis TaxID=748197 RepID=A0ABY7PIJ4_9BACT|nr:RagB/SusD family nutrient uptake outer membrane protein [Hymenobacter yonginensis]WBO83147.1 RagB/SusD family nutrient uptake outer membrane protein [Hymenobacter yonginensis]